MSIYNMEVYKRERRAQRLVKTLAWLARNAAIVVLMMGFGALLALMPSGVFSFIALVIILAGIWGQHYLSTRH
jgi:uncharacterized membrane protein